MCIRDRWETDDSGEWETDDSGEWETDALFDYIYKFCDVDGSLLSTVCGPATLNRIKCKRDKMVT